MVKDSLVSRKESIMKEALRLFANQGYVHTSTKLIAKEAGVSEALIFKHFGNKDALLTYLIKVGYRKVLTHHRGMLNYKTPKDFLLNMLNLPDKLVKDEPLFWKLQERLSHHSLSRQQHELFMKPVQPILLKAFQELGYEQPEIETQFLLMLIDVLWKKIAVGELDNFHDIRQVLIKKYHLA